MRHASARIGIALCASLVVLVAAWQGLVALDRAYPPPLDNKPMSSQVLDRNGALLRAYAAIDGRWRLPLALGEVDPDLVAMLVAYEDRRFYDHAGVDPLALMRAAGQLVLNGRIVSGGSTITMQLARLLEPRSERSLLAKLRQIARAVQIERRLSKSEILERYLTLAPYGGNLEGLRAASLAWFGREPKGLSVGQRALLVALPQAPEARRPDRNPARALSARDRVLARMVDAGFLEQREADRARADPVPDRRLALPALAPHAADRALASAAHSKLTLDAGVQASLEAVAREAAATLGSRVSVAMLLADARSGEVLASIGSPDFLDARRAGFIDMTRVTRSPGSTLKPFIYALGFEEGIIAQETMIEDRPADFGGYRPTNFDMRYQGDVSVRTALQMSLNVPAIRVFDAVGPVRLVSRFRHAGVALRLPAGERPGLAIGLGGAGLTLSDLVQLYTGLANRGRAVTLTETPRDALPATPLVTPAAAWQVTDMLAGIAPPQGASASGIAYKTGTSYGYRDAWSIGYDGRHVLGVWVGRPDGAAVPGLFGYASAAPILFEAFTRSGLGITAFSPAPAGALRQTRAELPVTLRRFENAMVQAVDQVREPAPRIVFPPQGARLASSETAGASVALKIQGGRAPFRWLANGRPLEASPRRRNAEWTPDGIGFPNLTVIDAAGRAASVKIYVE